MNLSGMASEDFLAGEDFLQNFQSPNNKSMGASKEALEKLDRFRWGKEGATCQETSLAIDGVGGEIVLVTAEFGASLQDVLGSQVKDEDGDVVRWEMSGELALVDPISCHPAITNLEDIRGKVAVVERGLCTFAQKYARVQQAGAIAVLVVNTNEVWPYTMKDSTNEIDMKFKSEMAHIPWSM
jgi:hypothetical protein